MKCEPFPEGFFTAKTVGKSGPVRGHFRHSEIAYDKWRAMRRHYVGASEVSAIVGLNRWSGPFDVAAVKLGEVEPADPHRAMRMGTFFEPAIRSFFASELAAGHVEVPGGLDHGAKVCEYPYTLQHSKIPFLCCNLDGLVESADGSSLWGLEIKDAGTYARRELSQWIEGEKPTGTALMYWIQIQAQLCVSGLSQSLIVIRCDKDLMVGGVYRNEEAIARIEKQVAAFWNRYLAADKMPPVDSFAGATLDAMHPPGSDEGAADMPHLAEEVAQIRETLEDVKQSQKDLAKRESIAKNRLKEIIGCHETVTLGEGIKPIKWKTITRKDGGTYRRLSF